MLVKLAAFLQHVYGFGATRPIPIAVCQLLECNSLASAQPSVCEALTCTCPAENQTRATDLMHLGPS